MFYRILIIFIVLIIIISGCTINKNDEERDNNDNTLTESDNEVDNHKDSMNLKDSNNIISEVLLEYNLPLEGENVFDPKIVSIGDNIMGLKLVDIEVNEATNNYPFDTVVANFEGEIILSGTIKHTGLESEWYADKVLFIVDEQTSNKLPVSHHDIRKVNISYTYICFDNQEDVKKRINISPDEEIKNVKIKVKDYRIVYKESNLIDTAEFMEIIY